MSPILLLFLLPMASATATSAEVEARLMDEIFVNYSNKIPPYAGITGPDRQVRVGVNVYILSIYSISEANMDYSMTMFLRERWVDSRLSYVAPDNLTRLELAFSSMDKVWLPDLYILNEKRSDYHEVTVPNKLIHVYPDGTVQYSARVTGTFTCDLQLQKYPFDTQKCRLEFESYGQSADNVKFLWTENPIQMSDQMSFPQFEFQDVTSYNCDKDYYGIYYTCIGVSFVLERNYGYFITQIYIPTILIVILSWVNFWLDCEAVPARISLGLLTVLTMSTQSSGARADLPRVSYVKAIDVWMAVGLVFVFAALVEFAYVNVLTRVTKRRKSSPDITLTDSFQKAHRNTVSEGDIKLDEMRTAKRWCCFKKLHGTERARMVDKISRVAFPAAFAIFNIWYWVFYLVG